MTLPETMTIEGVRYKRLDRIANRVSTYAMYDCHLFRQLEGTTIDEVIADWQRECAAPDARYGAPYLCPVIVMEDKTEIRRVGKMVFREEELPAFRAALMADPDVVRLLAVRTADSAGGVR